MSQTIDSRVVEMKFDNKNFEKNVAESMKTLDNLTKRVENLEKQEVSFDKIGKAADGLDLSKLDKSLDAITNRFSIMGQVGASVLHNLTTDAYNTVKAFNSKVWGTVFGQMKTGGKARAQNVENAKFLLEGMGITYSKEVEDQISDAVADTAFGFDEAAMAMAQLSGASVQLGDDMDKALKGISGVAAMTNRSFSDIADIFVDAAATGKVSADAFNRLSERGLAAKSIMQDFYGVTGDQLNKLAKEGKISFNDFSKAMYDAFGTQAKKSNETLSGVLANTKAVLSRMGQSFYQPLMANNSDVVKFFQSLKDTMKGFEKPVKEVGAQLSGYVLELARFGKGVLDNIDVSKYAPMFERLKTVFENLYVAAKNLYTNVLKPLGHWFKEAIYEVFPSLNTGKSLLETLSIKLVEASERFRKFTAEIGLFGKKGESLKDVLVGILTVLKIVFKVLKAGISVVTSVLSSIGQLTGGLSGAIAGLSRFITIAANVGYQIINGLGVGLSYGVAALMSAIINIGHIIVDTFCNFFGIHSPSRLMIAMVGIPIVAGIAAGILKGFPEVKEAIHTVLSGIIGLVGQVIGTVLTGVSKIVVNTFSIIFNTVTNVLNAFANAVNRINTDKLEKILSFIKNIAIVGAELFIIFRIVTAVNSFASAASNFAKAAKKMATAFELFMARFTLIKLGEVFAKFGNIFKNFAIMVGVISGAIIVFASMWKNGYMYELIGALGMMMLLAAAMAGLIKEITKIDGDQLKSAAYTLLGFGAAMYAMASGIKKLGKMEWYEILTAVVAMGAVLGGLSYLAYKLRDGEAWYSQINYKLILAFAAGVWLIAGSIRRLGKMPVTDILKGGGTILALVGVFGGISIALVEASKLTNGDLASGDFKALALAFVAFGVAIKMIAKTVIALGFIKPEKLDQGLKAIAGIMVLMTALMFAAQFVYAEVTAFFLSFTVLIGAMAAAIYVIGNMETGVKTGVGSLIGIVVIIGTLVAVLAKINPDLGSLKSLAFIAALLGTMTATVKIIGEMDPKALKQGAIALGVIIVVLTGIILLWSKLLGLLNGQNNFALVLPDKKEKKKQQDSEKTLKAKIKYIKTIVNAVAELAIVAAGIGKFVKSPKEIAVGIGFIIASLAAILISVNSINKIGGDKDKSLKGMASAIRAIALVIVSLGATLILLSNMPIPGMLVGAAAIAGVLAVVAVIVKQAKVFGVQGMDPKPIYAAALVITAIGAAMTAILYVSKESSPWLVLAAAAGIALCIYAIGKAFQAAKDFKLDSDTGKALMMAAGSLLIVAGAIAIIAQFEWNTYSTGLIAAVGCIAAFGLIISLMSKYGGDNIESSSKALLIASLSVLAIAGAISIIAQFEWGDYWQGLLLATGCVAALGAVALLIGKFAGKSAIAGATSMVLVSAALAVAAASIAIIAQFNWDDYKYGLIAMSVCLGVLTAVAGVISYFTAGVGVIAGAASMILVAASMAVAAVSIAILAQYKWQDYVGSLIAMSVALTVLSAAAAAIGFFSVGLVLTGAAGMAIVAGAMVVAAASIAILAQFKWEDYVGSLTAMSVALGILTAIAALVGFFSVGLVVVGAASMAIVAGAMIAAAASIAILAQFEWQKYTDGLIWMSVCLGALSAVAALIGFFSAGAGVLTGAAAMAIVAGAMVVAATSIAILAQFDWIAIQDSLIGMSVALGVLSLIAGAMGANGKGSILGATAMAIVAGAVVVLALAFKMFAEVASEFFTAEKAQEIVSFFNTLSDGIPGFAESLATNLETAVTTLRTHVPPLKEELNKLVDDIADAMTELAQKVESRGTEVATAMGKAVNAIKEVIKKEFGINSPSKFMAEIGMWLMEGLKQGIIKFATAPVKAIVSAGKTLIESFRNVVGVHSMSTVFYDIGSWLFPGVTQAMKDSQDPMFEAAKSAGSGLIDSFKEGAKDLLDGTVSGSFSDALNNIFADLDIEALKGGDVSGLLSGFLQNGISLDTLGGDSLTTLVTKLKEAGIAGDGLNDILKALGISLDDLDKLGLKDALGIEEAKEGAEELKTSIQDLADEIIKGKFGNAPERWDKMFDHLVKAGMSAQDAYAAIAEAQNEVNKRLGNSVVHTADEMEKKVSEAAKKAAGDATGSKSTKETRDFKSTPHKAVTDTTASDAAKAAEEQMKRNMPYANYMATKEQQITAEREKQTVEAYKQKLANEHMYTLKEKEQAMAGLKANQELTTNSTLTAEKQKQLDAENKKYQAVIETYNKQQEMLDIIKKQEEATKAAEEAEKKRGEAAANTNKKAVTYGSAEYEAQKKGTTINNRKTIEAKTSGKAAGQIVADVKAAITPNVEVKSVDISQYKTQIVSKLETEVKELNTKVDITPKINTTQAEAQIQNFKAKTEELKTSIPQTFNGIAQAVSKQFGDISSKIISEGGKITSNTRAVFQNAVSAATGILTSGETISKFYNAGKSAVQGYANGMKANLATIKNAAAMMGNTSIKSTKATIKSNSPSKVFYQIGNYAGEGYVNGMLSTLDMVTNASAAVGEASTDELFNLAQAIQSSLDDGMDFTPSIVPVVDTSQIQNGLNYINSSFGQDQTMDILADINATRNFRDVEAESMQAQMDNLRGGLNDLATAILNQPDPVVNANVVLQGDANGVFKVVRNANAQYTKMHGKSAFA